jgi:hypothetical protein
MKNITALLVTALMSTAAMAQTANEVLNKFYDASGTKAAWSEINTYTLTRSFVANAPTDYEMEVNVSTANGEMSKRKSIMKRDFFYVVNGNDGWIKIPMGSMDKNVKYNVKDLSEGEKSSMQQEIKDGVLPLLNFDKKGFRSTFEGYKKYDGKTLAKVSLMRGDDTIDYFFDKETGLLIKEIYSSPKLTETWEHVEYGETNNGIKYPSKSVYLDSKANKKTTVSTKLDVNQTIDPVLFIRK